MTNGTREVGFEMNFHHIKHYLTPRNDLGSCFFLTKNPLAHFLYCFTIFLENAGLIQGKVGSKSNRKSVTNKSASDLIIPKCLHSQAKHLHSQVIIYL